MAAALPFAALRAFDAAARHLSFTAAAVELGMTQAAISYQIKILEGRLGSQLFLRAPRQVTLTLEGSRLAPRISAILRSLEDVFAESSVRPGEIISVSAAPTFATQWLASNLADFKANRPGRSVRLVSSTDVADFNREQFDVAIRGMKEGAADLRTHLLLEASLSPMMTNRFIQQFGIRTPGDLRQAPQVYPGDPWYALWLKQFGLVPLEPGSGLSDTIEVQTLKAGAAMAGHGFAMLSPVMFKKELQSGQLVRPFPETVRNGHGYFLVYPEHRRNVPKIRAFRDWIISATAPLRTVDYQQSLVP